MELIQIQSFEDMVNINHSGFEYGNIKGMYVGGNGHGLQISQHLAEKEEQIREACATISEQVYHLYMLLEDDNA